MGEAAGVERPYGIENREVADSIFRFSCSKRQNRRFNLRDLENPWGKFQPGRLRSGFIVRNRIEHCSKPDNIRAFSHCERRPSLHVYVAFFGPVD
jgi:hypothetical protein